MSSNLPRVTATPGAVSPLTRDDELSRPALLETIRKALDVQGSTEALQAAWKLSSAELLATTRRAHREHNVAVTALFTGEDVLQDIVTVRRVQRDLVQHVANLNISGMDVAELGTLSRILRSLQVSLRPPTSKEIIDGEDPRLAGKGGTMNVAKLQLLLQSAHGKRKRAPRRAPVEEAEVEED